MPSGQNSSKQDGANQEPLRSRKQKTSSKKDRKPQKPSATDSSSQSPANTQPKKLSTSVPDRPTTNPNLFVNQGTSRMASALPIWEASNILTQRHHLPWSSDADGKLCYAKDVGDGKGAFIFGSQRT